MKKKIIKHEFYTILFYDPFYTLLVWSQFIIYHIYANGRRALFPQTVHRDNTPQYAVKNNTSSREASGQREPA